MNFNSILELAGKKQKLRDEQVCVMISPSNYKVKRDIQSEKRRKMQRIQDFQKSLEYSKKHVEPLSKHTSKTTLDETEAPRTPTKSLDPKIHKYSKSAEPTKQSIHINPTVKKESSKTNPKLSFTEIMELAKQNVSKQNDEVKSVTRTQQKISNKSLSSKNSSSPTQHIPKPREKFIQNNTNDCCTQSKRRSNQLDSHINNSSITNQRKAGILAQYNSTDRHTNQTNIKETPNSKSFPSSKKSNKNANNPQLVNKETKHKPSEPYKKLSNISNSRTNTTNNPVKSTHTASSSKQIIRNSTSIVQPKPTPLRGIAAQLGLMNQSKCDYSSEPDDEMDSDDSFIDDSEAIDGKEYASVVKNIHKSLRFDPRKYASVNPFDDLKSMESNYRQIEREEKISLRIGAKEDHDDMLQEIARKKRK